MNVRNYKLALALLYFLQLLIVFRESVAEAYKHAFEAINGKVELVEMDVATHHDALATRSGPHEPSEEPTMIIEHGAIALAAFVLSHDIHKDEHHVLHHHGHNHPETEDEAKKMRRKRRREIVIANLFPLFQRFAAPAQTENVPSFGMLRALSYPADAA